MKTFFTTILFVFLISNLNAQENVRIDSHNLTWYLDYEEAKTLSAKEGKPILLYFTGSDWCGACKLLEEKLFAKKQFQKLSKNFILVEVDFIKKSFNKEFFFANEEEWRPKFELKINYKVEGYPTSILFDKDGNETGRLVGFLGDKTKKKYIALLKSVL